MGAVEIRNGLVQGVALRQTKKECARPVPRESGRDGINKRERKKTMRKLITLGMAALAAFFLVAGIAIADLSGDKWIRLRGLSPAQDIGAGANGAVFMAAARSGRVHKWIPRRFAWVDFGGNLKRIDVDPWGNPWGVDSQANIHRHDGKKWIRMDGKAHDIGIGASGQRWIIGTNRVAGGFGIYRWRNRWEQVSGGAVRIDVGPKGIPWTVNDRGDISRFLGGRLRKMPGKARDVSVGANGQAMIIGVDGRPYFWAGSRWSRMTGGGATITVDRNGNPWIVDDRSVVSAWDKAAMAEETKASPAKKPSGRFHPGHLRFQVQAGGHCFDVQDFMGAKSVIGWDCNDHRAEQKFRVVYKNRQSFQIIHTATNMCVDVAGAAPNVAVRIRLSPCNASAARLWQKIDVGGGYFLLQAHRGNKCMDRARGQRINAKMSRTQFPWTRN